MAGTRKNARPMPADFAEVAKSMTQAQLAEHYAAGDATTRRWLKEIGDVQRKQRPLPEDFAEMRAKLGSSVHLQRHYHANWATVGRWLDEAGLPRIKPKPPTNAHPLPDTFALAAPTMTQAELERRYGVDRCVIRRWCGLLGIKPMPRPTSQQKGPFVYKNWSRVNHAPTARHYTPQDEAADILRAHAPTYRCDDRGRANPKGPMWRFGNAVLDGDELLVRAERYRKVRA